MALWAAISVTAAQTATVIGTGTRSCGEWTDDQRHGVLLPDEAWLAGYLSGYSVYSIDGINVTKGLDPGARDGWVSNYCLNHPLDPIWMAADQLIVELKRQASQH